jgi:hypothetical protein
MNNEIKKRLNSDNACCSSVYNLLLSYVLSKNLKIKIVIYILLYMNVKFGLTLRVCET